MAMLDSIGGEAELGVMERGERARTIGVIFKLSFTPSGLDSHGAGCERLSKVHERLYLWMCQRTWRDGIVLFT